MSVDIDGDYELASGNDNAGVGDIVHYTFSIMNNGSITLDTIDLLTYPTVSSNPTVASTEWSKLLGGVGKIIEIFFYQSDVWLCNTSTWTCRRL